MLRIEVVQEVWRLLQEGKLSQRQIAAKLGVSRGTVGAIANGKRGLFGKDVDRIEPHERAVEVLAERCPGCGARVFKPCQLCRARAYRAWHRRVRTSTTSRVA